MLGMYRLLYVVNWIYRYTHEYHYSDIIVWVAGVVQTALYMDFFLHYFQVWRCSLEIGSAAAFLIDSSFVQTKKQGIDKAVKIGLPV